MCLLAVSKYATVLFILLERIHTCSTQLNCPNLHKPDGLSGHIGRNTHRNDIALNVIVDISPQTCVTECLLRSHCEAVSYERLFHLCRLFDAGNQSLPVLETKPGSVYIDIHSIAIDQVYMGTCRSRDCPAGYRCKDISGQKECEPSECPKPPDVAYADLRIMSQAKGTRAKYKCRDGYRHLGRSVIKCENNLIWTPTSFHCVEFQRLANMNAEIKIVRKAMDYGSAKKYCAQFAGGRLIKIDSEAKNKAVADILEDRITYLTGPYAETTSNDESDNYFIDGHYDPEEGRWTYSDGKPVLHCCWSPGEPNLLGSEHCIAKWHNFGYYAWNNVACSRGGLYSICEVQDE